MRNFKNIAIKELFDQLPTIEEAYNYNYTWYKEREEDYGDFYKNELQLRKIADFQLNSFMQLYKDKNNLTFIEEAEEELKNNMGKEVNSFQHASTIHALAIKQEREWDQMIEEIEEMTANL